MAEVPTPEESEAAMLEGFGGGSARQVASTPTPRYVFEILGYVKTGKPLDFRSLGLPDDVREWCEANLEPTRVTE